MLKFVSDNDKRQEVQAFLDGLHAKMKIRVPPVLYLDFRPKNSQTLIDLQMIPKRRDEIIESLKVADYCHGPVEDRAYMNKPMWVFGKKENGVELYIKIALGHDGASAFCISFHKAEFPMKYYY